MGLAAGCLLAARILLHYFQLESYQFPGYFRTIRRNILKAVLPGLCMTVLLSVSLLLLSLAAGEVEFPWYLYFAETAVLIAGGIMMGCVRLAGSLLPENNWVNLGIMTLTGIAVYGALSLLDWKVLRPRLQKRCE